MESTENSKPLVSVLIAAYNVEKYIEESIQSILDQTYKNLEILVVDDCSKDKTLEIVEQLAKKDNRVRVFKNDTNLSVSNSTNKILKVAKGKYIAKMDSDDYAYPTRLEKQVEFLEKNPKVGIVGAHIEVCDEKLNVLNIRKYNLTDEKIREKIFKYSPFAHPVTTYRADLIKSIDGYKKDTEPAADYDFYFRIGRFCEFANLDEVMLKLRVNPNSVTQRKGQRQEMMTLYLRLKATMEYGYNMKFSDKIYFALQYLSTFILPFKTKFWLFNALRKLKSF